MKDKLDTWRIKSESSDKDRSSDSSNSSSSDNSLFIKHTQFEDHNHLQAFEQDKAPYLINEDGVSFESETKQNLFRNKSKLLLHQREIAEIIERNYKSVILKKTDI